MIILDARRMKAYEYLGELGKIAGRDESYLEELWGEFLGNDTLMSAFMYYLDTHSLDDGLSCEGYGLTDLYFYNMRRYELRQDLGKNYADCNKEGLALDTFLMMGRMLKDPKAFLPALESGPGMDMQPG
ncbi:MAG: hypothetical protein IKO11_00900 [Lachnospiraceae bacterium]|nr:hypothetical protein [Lachnospiraceae bacterium]